MIFVFHGDNQPALREGLLELKKRYSGVLFWEEELENLSHHLSSPSLFSGKELIAVEDVGVKEGAEFASSLKEEDAGGKDVVMIFPRKLKKFEVKKFPNAKVKHFYEEAPQNIFPFLDALVARRRKEALSEVKRLSKEGNDTDYLIKMIAWQFRSLARVKGGATKGISPYVVRKLKRFTGDWSQEDLRHVFSSLLQEDLKLKRGKPTPMELLVKKIIG